MSINYWFTNEFSSVDETLLNDVNWHYKQYKNYMYARLQEMFTYKNLPDTIPEEMLELYLLSAGTCFIAKYNDSLYAFQGSFGGEPDAYYRPTLYTVANPALNLSEQFKIGIDGILMRNDKMWVGLDNLVSRYAYLMATNLITIKTVDIVLRCLALISAPDDKSKRSAEEFLTKLEKGEIGVIAENPFFEGIKMQSPPSNNGSYLTQFIELHQYYKGSFYNEIGLNANFNMKREAIGKGEASLSQDSLLPLCDSMLECRIKDVEKINEMFGTNIEVDFSSVWKENQKESILEIKKLEKEASQLEGSDESGNEKTESGEEDFRIEGTDSEEGQKRSEGDDEGVRKESEGTSNDTGERKESEEVTEPEETENDSSDDDVSEIREDNKTDSDKEYNQEINIIVNVNDDNIEEKQNAGEEEEDSEDK